jgi:hypothetical protein
MQAKSRSKRERGKYVSRKIQLRSRSCDPSSSDHLLTPSGRQDVDSIMVYKPTPEDFISWHGSPLRATHLDPAAHVYIRVNLTGVTSDFQSC